MLTFRVSWPDSEARLRHSSNMSCTKKLFASTGEPGRMHQHFCAAPERWAVRPNMSPDRVQAACRRGANSRDLSPNMDNPSAGCLLSPGLPRRHQRVV